MPPGSLQWVGPSDVRRSGEQALPELGRPGRAQRACRGEGPHNPWLRGGHGFRDVTPRIQRRVQNREQQSGLPTRPLPTSASSACGTTSWSVCGGCRFHTVQLYFPPRPLPRSRCGSGKHEGGGAQAVRVVTPVALSPPRSFQNKTWCTCRLPPGYTAPKDATPPAPPVLLFHSPGGRENHPSPGALCSHRGQKTNTETGHKLAEVGEKGEPQLRQATRHPGSCHARRLR